MYAFTTGVRQRSAVNGQDSNECDRISLKYPLVEKWPDAYKCGGVLCCSITGVGVGGSSLVLDEVGICSCGVAEASWVGEGFFTSAVTVAADVFEVVGLAG